MSRCPCDRHRRRIRWAALVAVYGGIALAVTQTPPLAVLAALGALAALYAGLSNERSWS